MAATLAAITWYLFAKAFASLYCNFSAFGKHRKVKAFSNNWASNDSVFLTQRVVSTLTDATLDQTLVNVCPNWKLTCVIWKVGSTLGCLVRTRENGSYIVLVSVNSSYRPFRPWSHPKTLDIITCLIPHSWGGNLFGRLLVLCWSCKKWQQPYHSKFNLPWKWKISRPKIKANVFLSNFSSVWFFTTKVVFVFQCSVIGHLKMKFPSI